jgi:Spy/CpxP family protein refolding chaperone
VALEPAQRAQVAELRARFLAHREAHARRTGEMRERLARLLVQDNPDWDRIDREIAEISRAQGSLQRTIVEHVLAVRRLLQGEQRLAFTRGVGELVRAGRALPADCARLGAPGVPSQ